MTTATTGDYIPELTLGWRLKMALGDMKRDEMAETLGVNPATVSRWCADKGAAPKRAYIIQFALITGVSPSWLETGEGTPSNNPEPPRPGKRDDSALAALIAEKSGRGTNDRYPSFTPDETLVA